jgi:hypothetical protein
MIGQPDNARHRFLVPRRQFRRYRFRFTSRAAPAADYLLGHG